MQFNCNQGKWSSTDKEIEQSPRTLPGPTQLQEERAASGWQINQEFSG